MHPLNSSLNEPFLPSWIQWFLITLTSAQQLSLSLARTTVFRRQIHSPDFYGSLHAITFLPTVVRWRLRTEQKVTFILFVL